MKPLAIPRRVAPACHNLAPRWDGRAVLWDRWLDLIEPELAVEIEHPVDGQHYLVSRETGRVLGRL